MAQIRKRAMKHWRKRRMAFGLTPKPSHRVSSTVRQRKTLNHLQHQFTNYDGLELELDHDDQALLRARVNTAILEVLEELAP